MKVALLGFIQSGKSTLLSAISGKPITLSGSNNIVEAIVSVPDDRLQWLTTLYKPKKTVFASVDCLDLPGFSLIDEAGRAGARKLFAQARTVDMFVLVVRAFMDERIPMYRGSVDPKRDVNELVSELLLSDLELVSTRIEKLKAQIQKGSKTAELDKEELSLQLKLQDVLENGKPLNTLELSDREDELIKSLGFLTQKPIMIVINTDEGRADAHEDINTVVDKSVPVLSLCAKIEQELSTLDEENRKIFMDDLGISENATGKFVKSCYSALGLISFLTVGPDEVRAWPIKKGASALEAAGKIHSDIKRGFIRAETMSYSDLKELGNDKAVKAAGKARLEGKTYTIEDGDIINFRFNV